MNRTIRWISVSLASIVVVNFTACGKANEAAESRDPPPPKETVFDDLIATKERAKQQAEQAAQQSKENLDAAMKEADGASAAQKPTD